MAKRESINIDGLSHLTAIPVASKVGPLLVSSVIAPFTLGTRDLPDSLDGQYANIFRHVDAMLAAAGGDWSDVAKMEFWIPGKDRSGVEPFWLEKFPDEASRPARHTHGSQGKAVTASFLAYIGD